MTHLIRNLLQLYRPVDLTHEPRQRQTHALLNSNTTTAPHRPRFLGRWAKIKIILTIIYGEVLRGTFYLYIMYYKRFRVKFNIETGMEEKGSFKHTRKLITAIPKFFFAQRKQHER